MTEALPNAPVLPRATAELPPELPGPGEMPSKAELESRGFLLAHQSAWLADKSPLKIAEKGRRTGITFAEAWDAMMIAAAAPSAGGSNYFYVGDTKEKGVEFVTYVANFATKIAGALHEIEEFLFEDQDEDGNTRQATRYRVKFASGFRVEALSSNPAAIRGLQGTVCIDEAAFHKDVRQVIDAVNAMLIHMGKVRIISTHNGHLNPFNELIREANAGGNPFRVHHIPFKKAVESGLFGLICRKNGLDWSEEAEAAWEAQIRGSYGARTAQMRQELDAIPAEAEGAALTRVQIEAALKPLIPVLNWTCPDDFKGKPEKVREAAAKEWCEQHLKPVLSKLDENLKHVLGEDFARNSDATVIMVDAIRADLVSEAQFAVEMRNVPFEQQKQVFFFIGDHLPNFIKGAVDKGGNGAYLAEVATQRYGDRIIEVSFSREWYAREMPPYIDAIAERTVIRPKHADVLSDHQALQYVDGIIRVPANFRFKGSDGFDRHGDSAVAGALAHFASRQDWVEYDYTPVKAAPETGRLTNGLGFEEEGTGWWTPPLGARLRGRI